VVGDRMTVAERKKRDREARQEEIINTAEKLFFSRGYDSVSMNDIAAEAEVPKSLLYYYFKDKESLFFAIVLRAARIFDRLMDERVALEPTGIGKLRANGTALFEFSVQYPDYYDVYFYSGSQRFRTVNNEYGPEIMKLGMKTLEVSIAAAQQGLEDGTLRQGLNPIEVAVFLARASEGIVKTSPALQRLLDSQGISREQFMKDSVALLEHAIMSISTEK
jgi:TetR/AcrR family transcriptional regulator